MIYSVLLVVEIITLFFLSRSINKALSRHLPVGAMFFALLPGIVVHELSHVVAATLLFVPVGHMELMPKKDGNEIRLGRVMIAKTDPLRRFAIGASPILAGIIAVIGSIYAFNICIPFFQKQNITIFIAAVLLLAYLLFAIGNTMFSSGADMKGAAELLAIVAVVVVVGYLLGVSLPLSFFNKMFTKEVVRAIQQVALFLPAPIAIDLIALSILKAFGKVRLRQQS